MTHAGNATLQRGLEKEDARLEPGAPTAGNATLQRGSVEKLSSINPGNLFSPAATQAWHSRGYVPHVDVATAIQHVTFHLADSLPAEVRLRIESELRAIPEEHRDRERFRRIEDWIDAGHGCCALRQDAAAAMIQDSLLHFESIRYRLYAWVVMPNHVHVLFQAMNGWSVAKIVTSWKSFTGRRLSTLIPDNIGAGGRRYVWHREYWDRFIRNQRHFTAVQEYIYQNPVKAGLVNTPEGYRWSSAYGNATLQRGLEKEDARLEPGAPTAGNATLQRGLTKKVSDA